MRMHCTTTVLTAQVSWTLRLPAQRSFRFAKRLNKQSVQIRVTQLGTNGPNTCVFLKPGQLHGDRIYYERPSTRISLVSIVLLYPIDTRLGFSS